MCGNHRGFHVKWAIYKALAKTEFDNAKVSKMVANVARFGLSFTTVLAILAGSGVSQAAFDVDMSFTGLTGLNGTVSYYDKEVGSTVSSGEVGIGALNWTVLSSTDPSRIQVGADISTFCIELKQAVTIGLFNFDEVANAQDPHTSSPFPAPNETIGTVRAGYLGRLFDLAYDTLSTNDQFAAFQLAVWELSHETVFDLITNPFAVTTGTFQLVSGTSDDAKTQANSWLAAITADGFNSEHTLNTYALLNPDSQDQIFSVPAATASSVPEATAVTTWALMMLTVGFITNRVRAAA